MPKPSAEEIRKKYVDKMDIVPDLGNNAVLKHRKDHPDGKPLKVLDISPKSGAKIPRGLQGSYHQSKGVYLLDNEPEAYNQDESPASVFGKNGELKKQTEKGKEYAVKEILSYPEYREKRKLTPIEKPPKPDLLENDYAKKLAEYQEYEEGLAQYEADIGEEAKNLKEYGSGASDRFSKNTASGRYYLYLYDKGLSLSTLLSENNLTVKQRLDIASILAKKIAELHKKGMLHGDLKPANMSVEFGESGEVKDVHLFDFGLAGTIDRLRGEASCDCVSMSSFNPEQLDTLPHGKHHTVYIFSEIDNKLFYVNRKQNTCEEIPAQAGKSFQELQGQFTQSCRSISPQQAKKIYDIAGNVATFPRHGTKGYKPLEAENSHVALFDPVNAEVFAAGVTIFQILTGQTTPELVNHYLIPKLAEIEKKFFRFHKKYQVTAEQSAAERDKGIEAFYEYALPYYQGICPLDKLRSQTAAKTLEEFGLGNKAFEKLNHLIETNFPVDVPHKGKHYQLSPHSQALIQELDKTDLGLEPEKYKNLKNNLIKSQLCGQLGIYALDAKRFSDTISLSRQPSIEQKVVDIIPAVDKTGNLLLPRPKKNKAKLSKEKQFTTLVIPASVDKASGSYGEYSPASGIYPAPGSTELKTETQGRGAGTKGVPEKEKRPYAIKRIPARQPDQSEKEYLAAIFNEVRLLREYGPGASLHIGRDRAGNHYIYFYQAPGITLQKLLSRSQNTHLPFLARINIVLGLSRQTATMYADEMLHHDLKGENILVALNDDRKTLERLTLIDFGAGQSISSARKEAAEKRFGTPGYVPLEIYAIEDTADPNKIVFDPVNQEVFAKGVLILEALIAQSSASLCQNRLKKGQLDIMAKVNNHLSAKGIVLSDEQISLIGTALVNYIELYYLGQYTLTQAAERGLHVAFYQQLEKAGVAKINFPSLNVLDGYIEQTFPRKGYQFDGLNYELSSLSQDLLAKLEPVLPNLGLSEEKSCKLKDTLIRTQLAGQLGSNTVKLEEFDAVIADVFDAVHDPAYIAELERVDELAELLNYSVAAEPELPDLVEIVPDLDTIINLDDLIEVEEIELDSSDWQDSHPQPVADPPAATAERGMDYFGLFQRFLNKRIREVKIILNQQIKALSKDSHDAHIHAKIAILKTVLISLDETKVDVLKEAKGELNQIRSDKTSPLKERNKHALAAVEKYSKNIEQKITTVFNQAVADEKLIDPRSRWQKWVKKNLVFTKYISKPFYEWMTRTNTAKILQKTFKRAKQRASEVPAVFFAISRKIEAREDNPHEAQKKIGKNA